MRQFFVAYRDRPDLSTLLRELPWSANLHVLTKCKRSEEREFYLRTATGQRSPTFIAEYQTRLPDRKLLQAKLHEFYALTDSATLCNPVGQPPTLTAEASGAASR